MFPQGYSTALPDCLSISKNLVTAGAVESVESVVRGLPTGYRRRRWKAVRAWGEEPGFSTRHDPYARTRFLLPIAPRSLPISSRRERGNQAVHLVGDGRIVRHQGRDLVARVHHGGVVPPADQTTDLDQREVGELADEIHRHLPRQRNALRPPLTAQRLDTDAEALRRRREDALGGHPVGLGIHVVLQHLLGERHRDFLVQE